MIKKLTALTFSTMAAAMVVFGLSSYAHAQDEPSVQRILAIITDPQVDVMEFKMDIAAFRAQCDILADEANATNGFIRPANIHDNEVLTHDLCGEITGTECVLWACVLVD